MPQQAREKKANFSSNSADRSNRGPVDGKVSPQAGNSESPQAFASRAIEELYRQLDGVLVRDGGVEWRLKILGIHPVGDERWVQVAAVAGGLEHEMILHMATCAQGSDAVASIQSWLREPLPSSRVINVL